MAGPFQRRWFRFSLRSLLILVIVIAIPLAWIAKERRQSQRELNIAAELLPLTFDDVEIGGPYDSVRLRTRGKPQGWGRNALRQLLGERVRRLRNPVLSLEDLRPLASLTRLDYLDLDNSAVSDLAPLEGLTNLQWLDLRGLPVSDIAPLASLTNLESLSLDSTQVRDITPLAELRNLESLNLRATPVQDLTPLVRLSKLKKLSLDLTPVTRKQVDALQKALSDCEIAAGPFADSD